MSLDERAHAVAIGERAAGLLDHHHHRGEVVGLQADGVDREIHRALGHEHVLPEVAEPAGPVRGLLQLHQFVGETEVVPAGANVTHTCASSSAATSETCSRRPSANAPSPLAAHQRRPIAGADTTPTTAPWSAWVSAISVAHTGMPRTKLLVPSIGSTIQRHGLSRRRPAPCSSPNRPCVRPLLEHGVRDGGLGVAVGLGDLGAVRLPVEAERAVRVVRQRDRRRRGRPAGWRTAARRTRRSRGWSCRCGGSCGQLQRMRCVRSPALHDRAVARDLDRRRRGSRVRGTALRRCRAASRPRRPAAARRRVRHVRCSCHEHAPRAGAVRWATTAMWNAFAVEQLATLPRVKKPRSSSSMPSARERRRRSRSRYDGRGSGRASARTCPSTPVHRRLVRLASRPERAR